MQVQWTYRLLQVSYVLCVIFYGNRSMFVETTAEQKCGHFLDHGVEVRV